MNILILLLISSAFAGTLETKDRVSKLQLIEGKQQVTFAEMSRLYYVKSDQVQKCLQESLEKKKVVRVVIEDEKGEILECR